LRLNSIAFSNRAICATSLRIRTELFPRQVVGLEPDFHQWLARDSARRRADRLAGRETPMFFCAALQTASMLIAAFYFFYRARLPGSRDRFEFIE